MTRWSTRDLLPRSGCMKPPFCLASMLMYPLCAASVASDMRSSTSPLLSALAFTKLGTISMAEKNVVEPGEQVRKGVNGRGPLACQNRKSPSRKSAAGTTTLHGTCRFPPLSALHITTARMLLPSRNHINGSTSAVISGSTSMICTCSQSVRLRVNGELGFERSSSTTGGASSMARW